MNDAMETAVQLPGRLLDWLRRAVAAGASDLQLIPGYPPVLRLHGDLTELRELPHADLFPQDVQRDVRAQLALSLRAVVAQRLLPGTERGAKRHLALEVLWNTNPIASAVRAGKLESIDNYLLTGRESGMLSFDESVRQLWRAGKISQDVAEQNVRDVSLLGR